MIKVVDRGVWFTICKIALSLDICSAMLAEIKGCELLLRTMNEIVKDGDVGIW